jgi:hypothetical protein
VDVQRNNINTTVVDTVRDLVGKVERRQRKTRITQQIINKMNGRRKRQNDINEVRIKNYRNRRELLKGTTDKPRRNTFRTYVAR